VKILNTTSRYWSWRLALATGALAAAFALWAADSPPTATETKPAATAEAAKPAAARPLEPGPNDGRIAYVTAQFLYQSHYSHHPLDNEWSEKFFDRYLEALDPQHLHFTQADVDEFDHYR